MTLLTVDAKLMPILPLIARPDSKSALVVAFGMGSAFRAALNAGLKTDAVELVPSVPTMFGYVLPRRRQRPGQPERQGRSSPTAGTTWSSPTGATTSSSSTRRRRSRAPGSSVISSLEYYQAGKAHLNPGGVMMQWLP